MKTDQSRDLIGCCGLYCGLCSKYQSKAPSRCLGCKAGEQHSWCSIWNCCVKKRQLETCAQCQDLSRCKILKKRKFLKDPGWIPAPHNLRTIKKVGLEKWLEEQKKRQALLEVLLQNYNEGRSMSFYCKACSRMSVELINKAVKEANKKLVDEDAYKTDIKLKAKFLKLVIKYLALKADVTLNQTG
jgi:hypothetical protein